MVQKQQIKIAFFIAAVLLGLMAGCSPTADYDIQGEWVYTMIAVDGNTYDTGTITFSGSPTEGTFVELNIYAIEYTGEYKVNGTSVTLTGDEGWRGSFIHQNRMSGTWEHDDGFSGTWQAERVLP